MDFLASGLVNASARLGMAGLAHDFASIAGLPALVGDGFTVTRSGGEYMVEVGDEGMPVASVDDIAAAIQLADSPRSNASAL